MLVEFDEIGELKDKILDELIKENYPAHQKILSEQQLAKLFDSTQNRVHRALQRLIESGYLYSKPKGGTFIAEKKDTGTKTSDLPLPGLKNKNNELYKDDSPEGDLSFPNLPRYKTLKIFVPVHGASLQVKLWENIFRNFTDQYPFFKIDVDFYKGEDFDIGKYDVIVNYTYDIQVDNKPFQPLDEYFNENDLYDQYQLPDNILDTGKANGKFCGIPVLRTTSIISVNKILMQKYNIDLSKIRKPIDLMKIGDIVEKSDDDSVYGTRYLGFYYHAAMCGIVVKRKNNRFSFDLEKMRHFMTEHKPWIKKHHFKDHKETNINDFKQGKYLLFSHFINDYPFNEEIADNFMPIPFPVEDDGFACEGSFLVCINRNSKNKDEALILLRSLITAPMQRLFVMDLPKFLSIRKDILKEQEQQSSFPDGAIKYDFDIRSFYTQRDPIIYMEYGDKINTELGKYFMDLQDIDKTLKNLEYL